MSMKKMITAIMVMAVVLVGVIVGYIVTDRRKQADEQKAAEEEASLTLFDFDADSITSVDIQNPDGHFHVEKQSGWVLTDTDYPHEMRLNTYYITNVCAALCDLTATNKIEVEESRLADYGFADPVTVTVSDGMNARTLLIGNAAATKDSWYVKRPDDKAVYAIDYTEGEMLRGGAAFVKSIYMIEEYDVNINAVRLERGNETVFDFVRPESSWEITEPIRAVNIDASQINAMLTYLTRIYYTGFPGYAEDAAEYGLDKPAAVLTIATADGESVFSFSEPTADGSSVYVLDHQLGQIGTISTNDTGFLNTKLNELLTTGILDLPLSLVSSMEAQTPELQFTMEVREDGYYFDGEPVDMTNTDKTAAFKRLYDAVPEMTHDAIAPDATPEADPECTFTITRTDGTQIVLTLIPTEDEHYLVAADGTYTGLTVRKNAVSVTLQNAYDQFTEMNAQ